MVPKSTTISEDKYTLLNQDAKIVGNAISNRLSVSKREKVTAAADKVCSICKNERCSVNYLVSSIINCNITSEAIRISTPKTRPNRQSYANVLRNGLMANIVHGENLTKVRNNREYIILGQSKIR